MLSNATLRSVAFVGSILNMQPLTQKPLWLFLLCSSNTYRIFDENLPDQLKPDQVYKDHKYSTRDAGETELLKTHNIPQPYNARFIRNNVRFLNEPFAYIETENAMDEQVALCVCKHLKKMSN